MIMLFKWRIFVPPIKLFEWLNYFIRVLTCIIIILYTIKTPLDIVRNRWRMLKGTGKLVTTHRATVASLTPVIPTPGPWAIRSTAHLGTVWSLSNSFWRPTWSYKTCASVSPTVQLLRCKTPQRTDQPREPVQIIVVGTEDFTNRNGYDTHG